MYQTMTSNLAAHATKFRALLLQWKEILLLLNSMDSPRILVARFLQANNFHETLDTFTNEANLPPNAGTVAKDDLTIERILEEKRLFDASLKFEKLGLDNKSTKWTEPAPAIPTLVNNLPSESNLLHVAIDNVSCRGNGSDIRTYRSLLASTADRQLYLIQPESPHSLLKWNPPLNDAPILSSSVILTKYLITTSMSGRVALYDCEREVNLDERQDHKKYVVKVACHENSTVVWIATAGWDSRVFIYRMDLRQTESEAPKLGSPVASIHLPTNPEDVLLVPHPTSSLPIVVVTRRDSSSLHYYILANAQSESSKFATKLLGKQNLAPQSNAWISFTPSSIAICPIDSSIIAVATSAMPHMKLLIVRMLISSFIDENRSLPANLTQTSQAYEALALEDREAAAILVHCNTLAPQTQYSTPAVTWRPDGSGVWVNGDDGVIRGVEVSSGRIVANLLDGHEAGVKIRCVQSGLIDVNGDKVEVLLSGGFDRRLIIWNVAGSFSP